MASAAESDPDRDDVVRACVEQHVGPVRSLEPVAADLGLRRFVRVWCEGPVPSVIARIDAEEDPAGRPAGVAAEPPLEPIRALLERRGLPVPRCLGADDAQGILLLEDFGAVTLEAVATDPAQRDRLYPEILRDVARLQRIEAAPGVAAFERRLDAALFAYKAELFAEHGLRRGLGRAATAAERRVVDDAFARVASACARAPQRLAHRDLQSRNVLIPADGRARWIDLQGAFLAPPEYDCVALLRDSYVSLPEERVTAWCDAIRPELPDAPSADAFAERFDQLTPHPQGQGLRALRGRRDPPRTPRCGGVARPDGAHAAPRRRAAGGTRRCVGPARRARRDAAVRRRGSRRRAMRAMIVAAGLGTRLRPLTEWRPKPAVPIRGLPLIAYPLALLARAGVRDVAINLHHKAALLEAAARASCPDGVTLHFSHETELLHTGGGIRKVASFLAESDPCLLLGGDMVVDVDLDDLVARHRASGRDVTMLLRRDPRAAQFGTIGLDGRGDLARIGERITLGDSVEGGVYTWVNVLSPRAFDTLPERRVFNHLDDWWAPAHAAGALRVGAELLAPESCAWEPVGTPSEYLAANLHLPSLSYLDVDAVARKAGTRFEDGVVIGAGATLAADSALERAVVWDGERVPAGLHASDGVFAGGGFVSCLPIGGETA